MTPAPLRLYALSELPVDAPSSVVVCRTRPNWWAWSFLTVTLTACAFLVTRSGGVRWAGIWIGLWTGLMWTLTSATVRRAAHPDAWLLRIADDGLWVKFRSYLHVRRPRDETQVVFLPWSQLTMAREHRRKWITPRTDSGGGRDSSGRFLELQLGDADTSALEKALAHEHTLSGFQHTPVSLEPGALLRIEWYARPRLHHVLPLLEARGVELGARVVSASNLTGVDRGELTTQEEAELAELSRRGDTMGVIRVLRARSGMSLVEAREKAKALAALAVALLVAACSAASSPPTPSPAAPTPDAAVYASLLSAMHPRDQGETLLVADSTIVFRQLEQRYRPQPGVASGTGAGGRADSVRGAWWRRLDSLPAPLLRALAETSSRVRSSAELSLPKPMRQISATAVREIFRAGPGEGWVEFARRYPGARRYSAFSPVVYSADGRSALVYYEYHCGGLCGAGHVVLLERRADDRWHVSIALQTWVS